MVNYQLENSPYLLCVLDFQGNIKQVNSAAWQQLGVMSEHLLITTFMQWIHPDDIAHTQDFLSKLCNRKSEQVVFETRWRNIKGEYSWFLWIATASSTKQLIHAAGLRISTPKLSSFHSSFQRHPSKANLKNLQATLWATTGEAIFITDTQLRILDANPASTDFTGYTTLELVGKSLSDFNTGQQDAKFYQQIINTMNQRGHWQGNIWQRHKGNAIYNCELKLRAYDSNERVFNRYVAVLSHISSGNSTLDPLTNLPSRQLFHYNMSKTLAQAQRHKKNFAILLISVDDILVINAKYGCVIGDKFLCAMGQSLKALVRNTDTVARYSGNKFGVNLEEIAKPQDVALVSQVLLFKLTQKLVLNEQNVQGSISIGAVVYPNDATDIDVLLELAEKARQRAELQGGNQCLFNTSF